MIRLVLYLIGFWMALAVIGPMFVACVLAYVVWKLVLKPRRQHG